MQLIQLRRAFGFEPSGCGWALAICVTVNLYRGKSCFNPVPTHIIITASSSPYAGIFFKQIGKTSFETLLLFIMASIAPTLRDAIEETTRVVLSLLADELQRSCVLVGGAALLRHDLCRKTEDVDFAVTLAAQFAVVEGARAHPRFSVDEMRRSSC